MARSGTYGTKQNKVEDCRQWPMHHQGATGVSKYKVMWSFDQVSYKIILSQGKKK